ncbi:nucleoside triphosphate pyrophosphohydrolase [Streptomyces sp. NPDC051080]|uniref:nucleoside triphosphate pyrophosphohydrolase n=1 Tax=Streptomyces sp. NPDC051080 TaxID=3157222 RepID=UPI0034446D6F
MSSGSGGPPARDALRAGVPGKLVRDRIPEIIRNRGAEPETYIASAAEYSWRLRQKLDEEVAEVMDADGAAEVGEELADVLEVVYALAKELGISADQLEAVRARKAEQRGGFADRVVWLGNLT